MEGRWSCESEGGERRVNAENRKSQGKGMKEDGWG